MMRKALYLLAVVMLNACVHEFPISDTPADVVLNINLDVTLDGQNFVNIAKEDEPSTLQDARESQQIQLKFTKVLAHSNVYYNEMADQLAKQALVEKEGVPEIRRKEEMEPWNQQD